MASNSVNNRLTDAGLNLVGTLYIDPLDAQGNLTGYLPKINATEVSISVPSELVQRISTGVEDYGLALDSWTEKKAPEIGIKHNSLGRKMIALQLLGVDSDISQTAATDFTETKTLIHDRWIDVSKGAISEGSLAVVNGATTYVEGTDYVVKYEHGMIMALSTGAIPNKQACALTYDSPLITGYEIDISKKEKIEVALKFVGKNRATNNDATFYARKVVFSPDGAIAFMGKEAATAGLKGTAILVAGESKAITYKETHA